MSTSDNKGEGNNSYQPEVPITNLESTIQDLMHQIDQLKTQQQGPERTQPERQLTSQNTHVETYKVSTKVPKFHPTKPDLWFLQIEAQFRNNGVKCDQTKYDIVVGSLEPQYLDVVADVIRNPPQDNKYDQIKVQLINEYADSQQKKLKQLLQCVDLGDDKPSTLLRKMKSLSGTSMSDTVVESLWLSKLPETTRSIVSCLEIDLKKKAETADKIMEMSNFQTSVFETAIPCSTPTPNQTNHDRLETQVMALSKQVEALADQFKKTQYNRGRSNSRNRSKSRNRYTERNKFEFSSNLN